MAADKNPVRDIYLNVVNDVIDGVREAFLDDGMDELVLQELKQLWESKLATCKAVDRAPPPQPEPLTVVSPIRMQQAVPTTQMVHANMTQLHQPGAAAIQPQLMRLQTNQAGTVYGNISQLTGPAQIAASALPAAFIRQLVNYGQGQNPGLVLQGMHPASIAPAASVAPTDVSKHVIQLDGLGDSSSEEDDHDDDDDDEDDDDPNDADDPNNEEEDPLNSSDDVSDADPTEVFDAENVVVCQFEKINRCKNRWKFHLKDGIMNLNGRDYLFQKANGDAEW